MVMNRPLSADGQEIPAYYGTQTLFNMSGSPLDYILSQMNPFQTHTFLFYISWIRPKPEQLLEELIEENV